MEKRYFCFTILFCFICSSLAFYFLIMRNLFACRFWKFLSTWIHTISNLCCLIASVIGQRVMFQSLSLTSFFVCLPFLQKYIEFVPFVCDLMYMIILEVKSNVIIQFCLSENTFISYFRRNSVYWVILSLAIVTVTSVLQDKDTQLLVTCLSSGISWEYFGSY